MSAQLDDFAKEPGSTTGRLAGFACVLVQIAILLAWTNDYLTNVALAVLVWSAALGIRAPFRNLLRVTPTYVILAVCVVAKSVVSPFEVDLSRGYINSPLAFDLALFCILTQIGVLFGYVGRRIPIWFPVFTVISLLLLCDITLHGRSERVLLLVANIICTISAGIIFRASRRPAPQTSHSLKSTGWLPHLIAVITGVVVGGGSALLLFKYERSIDDFLAGTLGVGRGRTGQTGFSGEGTLASVTEWQAVGNDEVALRVFSEEEPGYLAGRAFSNFNGSKWIRTWQIRPESPPADVVFQSEASREQGSETVVIPLPKRGRSIFSLGDQRERHHAAESDAASSYFEVWPRKNLPPSLFRPEGCNYAALETPTLPIDAAGNVDLEKELHGLPYLVFGVPERIPSAPIGVERSNYLRTQDSGRPEQLRQALETTTAKIFGPAGYEHLSTVKKCWAIENYFRKNYRYQLGGMQPSGGSDRVANFLENYDFGHCEYFASASTLLLRHIGVPARYITGFVVQEKNDVGGFWVARDKDAHAWVEAWDDEEQRWRIVESTPSAGVPEGNKTSQSSQWRDAVVATLKKWRASLQKKNLQEELTARAADLLSPNALLSIGCFAGILAVILAVRQRRRSVSDDLVPFHEALDRMILALRSRGLTRETNETIEQFAGRVHASGHSEWNAEASKWLTDYSRTRFRRGRATDETLGEQLESLSDRARHLSRSIRRRRPRVDLQNDNSADHHLATAN